MLVYQLMSIAALVLWFRLSCISQAYTVYVSCVSQANIVCVSCVSHVAFLGDAGKPRTLRNEIDKTKQNRK